MDELPADIREQVMALYPGEIRAHACRAGSPEEFAAWQQRARPALRQLIGLEAVRDHCRGHRPSVALGEAEVMEGYRRIRGEIESEPGFRLPFWLLLPDGDGPFPVAITPHGHDRIGMDTYVGKAADKDHERLIEEEDRAVAVEAVRRGFLAIAPAARGTSTIGIPDVNRRHGGRDCRSQFMHAILAGRTATGERVWDVLRLLDWALERTDTDDSRVLVMGNSGGGVVTLYTAACEERVTCAVPSCSFAPFVGESGLIHHCDCNAVPGIARFGEIWDVAGLIAPRHLCIVNGRTDSLFPVPEVDRAVAGLRRIYQTAGAAERFEHHWGAAGHRFYGDLMWPFVERACGI